MFTQNLFTNIDTFSEKTQLNEPELFQLPGFAGAFTAFHVSSDSMFPTLQIGDIVVCKTIEQINDVTDGDIYAIVVAENSYVRRVKRVLNKVGEVIQLILMDDNASVANSFVVGIGQVKKLLKVTNKISSVTE